MFEILGWTLTAIGLSTAIPQLRRTLVTGNVDGVSAASQVMWMVTWLGWAVYAYGNDMHAMLASDLLGLTVDTVVLAVLVRTMLRQHGTVHTRSVLVRALWPLALAPILAVISHTWGLVGLALALSVADILGVIPQLRLAATSASLHGISTTAWGMRVVVYAGWIVYGLGAGHPESGAWAVVLLPAAVYVWVRAHRHQSRPAPKVPGMTVPARVEPVPVPAA